MEKQIEQIINRQFQRLKSALEPLRLPEIALDSVSKYIRFIELDIKQVIRNKEDTNGNTRELD